MTVWWTDRPEALADICRSLVGPYASLALDQSADTVEVKGTFPVLDGAEVLDRYDVLIRFPADYPDAPPMVWETGGRIPRLADRHNSDSACLFVPFEWQLRRPDATFLTFLDNAMRGYFIGQSLVELGDAWPYGERAHGTDGMLQALAEMVGVTDLDAAQCAAGMLAKPIIKGHWDCYCGSRRRLRDCHGNQLRGAQRKIREAFPPRG